jgi:hypothetical protein
MHVKCIHEFCSLLDHIPCYLIVYKDLELFSIDYEGFINNPLPFGFNTLNRIPLFLHVFEFQGPSKRQTYPNFLPDHFFRK